MISTVHRVKGLEFDQVIVVDPGDAPENDPIEQAERARLLYVAMTRPRDLLIHVKAIAKLTAAISSGSVTGGGLSWGSRPGECSELRSYQKT